MTSKIYAWGLLGRRLALVLLCYTLLRLLFLLNNLDFFAGESPRDLLLSFSTGLRFDLWAVSWSLLPLILLSFAPWSWQKKSAWQKSIWIYVFLINFWCFGLNTIDAGLYKFTGKRLTRDWLNLQADMQAQSAGLIAQYWWLGLVGLALLALLMLAWPRWKNQNPQSEKTFHMITGFAVVLFTALSMRGGLQLKPLSIAHAFTGGSTALGVLRMNSAFTFFRSQSDYQALAVRFFPGEEVKRDLILKGLEQMTSRWDGRFKGYNLVILLVESLASEYVGVLNQGKGYTPFLDELSKEATLFENNFANGRRSIEAVPAIVCGFPSLMGKALLLSPYQGLDLNCLPKMAGESGYSTHFFHGAYNGSMHFDSFSARAGFQNYFGFDEYGRPEDSDGSWGIYDEPMLQFMVEKLNTSTQPFMAMLFTLTSHNPYPIPPKYRGQFPEGELEIHASIGYADMALKKFFEAAEKTQWHEKTIYVITGDHTQKSVDPRYRSVGAAYRVPLWIYVPGIKLEPENPGRFTQHVDLLPTLAALIQLPHQPRLKFGQNIFSVGAGLVFNGDERSHWLLEPHQYTEYTSADGRFLGAPFDSKTWQLGQVQPIEAHNAAHEAAERLKAILDYHNQGVLKNKLYH